MATQRALLELTLADRDAEPASWREVAEDLLDACLQQERLLEGCLTLARSQAGLARRQPLDLATITDQTLRNHNPNELESVIRLEPARTHGDPALLERLTHNLISNAIHHNHPGGRIEITTHSQAGQAFLTVTNSGPQIAAAELRRLFQPFQQLNPRTPSARNGLGLGLPIVQAITRAHHATLTAKALNGGGLTVAVAFRR